MCENVCYKTFDGHDLPGVRFWKQNYSTKAAMAGTYNREPVLRKAAFCSVVVYSKNCDINQVAHKILFPNI